MHNNRPHCLPGCLIALPTVCWPSSTGSVHGAEAHRWLIHPFSLTCPQSQAPQPHSSPVPVGTSMYSRVLVYISSNVKWATYRCPPPLPLCSAACLVTTSPAAPPHPVPARVRVCVRPPLVSEQVSGLGSVSCRVVPFLLLKPPGDAPTYLPIGPLAHESFGGPLPPRHGIPHPPYGARPGSSNLKQPSLHDTI